jgi:hypothetical protein
MGSRDARRLGLVKAAEQGRVTNREAAQGLSLSMRQPGGAARVGRVSPGPWESGSTSAGAP